MEIVNKQVIYGGWSMCSFIEIRDLDGDESLNQVTLLGAIEKIMREFENKEINLEN